MLLSAKDVHGVTCCKRDGYSGLLLYKVKFGVIPPPPSRPNQMSDIKTSLKPTTPVLSKRYTKSARYVSPLIASHRSVSPVSRVDIQHLTIPAALFTDAVDPE